MSILKSKNATSPQPIVLGLSPWPFISFSLPDYNLISTRNFGLEFPLKTSSPLHVIMHTQSVGGALPNYLLVSCKLFFYLILRKENSGKNRAEYQRYVDSVNKYVRRALSIS